MAHGDFAKEINRCFSDRKLFLYDTFGSYCERGIGFDIEKGLTPSFAKEDSPEVCEPIASGPTIAAIKEKCPPPEKLVFRNGYFPETASPDVGEKFAFVSLDISFYKPTYAGLEFFYPRLHDGGVIFLHDYNDKDWTNTKCAVRDFEKASGPLKRIPLPDESGTLVIVK